MKKWLMVLCLLPLLAAAQAPTSAPYAKRWPLTLSSEQAGAFEAKIFTVAYARLCVREQPCCDHALGRSVLEQAAQAVWR